MPVAVLRRRGVGKDDVVVLLLATRPLRHPLDGADIDPSSSTPEAMYHPVCSGQRSQEAAQLMP